MEIHAPDKPIMTWKEALAHLVIVTVGILIALSFEGIREWRHQRALVEEANANLTTEIQDNRKELERFMGRLDPMRDRLIEALTAVQDLRSEESIGKATSMFQPGRNVNYILYTFDLAYLSTSSQTTAEITGAFGYMSYSDVKKFAQVYDQQVLFGKVQDRALNDALAAASLGVALDFRKASLDEIEAIKRQIRLAVGDVLAIEEVGNALKESYARLLGPAR